MRRKLAALLCALILCVPGLCASEMTDVSYPCDAEGCGYEGPFAVAVTGTETRGGAPGEWFAVQCPRCGTVLLTSWRQTGPAEPPPAAPEQPADPPREDPPPAAPEQPVTAPPREEPPPAAPEQPVTAPPAAPLPETQPPEVRPPEATPPPVPGENPLPEAPVQPAPGGSAGSGRTPEQDAGTALPEDGASGSRQQAPRRNLVKYPYFSSFYPSRRLNLEGDPEALAPVPGIRIYPAEGTSILQHMLDGE